MSRPIVWVVKEQVKQTANGPQVMDYSAAECFGTIKFITESTIPVHRKWVTAKDAIQVSKDIMAFCEAVQPQDFLILTGPPHLFYLIAAAIGESGKNFPNLLAWRREDSEYVALMGVDDWAAQFMATEITDE